MAKSDAEAARAQWLAQVPVIRRNTRRLEKALPKAYAAGVARWLATGAVSIPMDAQRDLAAVISAMWREAVTAGADFPGEADGDKSGFPALESKAGEITLFEQIMLDFISRFGAMRVAQILETTRNQIARMVEKGIRDGLGQEAIAKAIIEATSGIARTRARVIARTETHNAAMFASQEVAKASPSPMNKRWVSVYDARTRDFGEGDGVVDQANHRAMNEVTVGMDELFAVPRTGGHDLMTGPGDPNAPVYQVVNCRCALIYRRANRPWPKTGE
jgi:hypothetical protein